MFLPPFPPPLITRSFDKENVRTMAALKAYAEANPEDSG